jgi:methylmalonyl-CoA mutase N-terminal domain/subunit
LKKVKKDRDSKKAQAALENLKAVAQGTGNTMPAFMQCAEAYCTIGEMCDALRGVFGEQREFAAF